MKIQYVSDLHKEAGNGVFTADNVTGDVLVIAGDLHISPRKIGIILSNLPSHIPKLMVLGNHEYWGCDGMGKRAVEIRSAVATGCRRGYVLENDTVVLNGVRFIGCTLWTDIDNGKEIFAAKHGMGDYHAIRENGEDIRPGHTIRMHEESRRFLEKELSEKFNGPTAVITHHAPSWASIAPEYIGNPLNACFAANCDDIVLKYQPKVWIHGHMHSTLRYQMGTTLVVCNPYGYQLGGMVNSEFDPHAEVEVIPNDEL